MFSVLNCFPKAGPISGNALAGKAVKLNFIQISSLFFSANGKVTNKKSAATGVNKL